jgi:diguanylate cyclase (GGDEF)-like protein
MTQEKSSFELHLEKLKKDYSEQLPGKLSSVEEDWKALCEQWLPERIQVLHRNVHSLIGTSGTFGFTNLSSSARELEVLLKPLLEMKDASYTPDPQLRDEVEHQIQNLFRILNPHKKPEHSHRERSLSNLAQHLSDTRQSGTVAQDILIYYLDDELAAPELLIQNLISYGFKSKHFRTMPNLLDAIHKNKPSLVILDLMMPDISQDKVFAIARSIVNKGIKVFILSGHDDFHSRLASVRAGVQAYILKPADVPSLVGYIRNALNLNIDKPAHILIVDDQEAVAQFYSHIFQEVGMQVTIENNSLNALQSMENHIPDLLLLDLNMPDCSGDELAAVIRQYEEYQSIPILFLSADAAPERKTSLLEVGSDDLLSKDMPPTELLRQVKSRVERAKILTSMMYQDSLTGLLNHAQIQLAAERVFSHCQRNQSHFTIAMIDIDRFKSINDNYGHLTGDRVIKALAQLLQQRLRVTDYLGRFGGEEFMLVMPDINVNDAGNLINNLRKSFNAINFKEEDLSFNVSFSAGIADSNNMKSFMEQIKMADEALYRAKHRGRNLVCASIPGKEK